MAHQGGAGWPRAPAVADGDRALSAGVGLVCAGAGRVRGIQTACSESNRLRADDRHDFLGSYRILRKGSPVLA